MVRLSTIEGIGDEPVAKLKAAGVATTHELLELCSDSEGRNRIAAETGIDDGHLLRLVKFAELTRIEGVGAHFSGILAAAGVDSIPELARRKPRSLAATMRIINAQKRIVRRVPSVNEVARWVSQAKMYDWMATH